jgi:tetratricopeptide (TPR) repeat protein
MDSQTIRSALGHLQNDPESEHAWQSLHEGVGAPDGDLSQPDLLHLLDAARRRHGQRGEWDAVARLLEIEAAQAAGSEREVELQRERARVLHEELLDEDGAGASWGRIVELVPNDPDATAALEDSEGKRQKWRDLVSTYLTEADQAPDDVYKSSMLMRAAEMELRFSGGEAELNGIVDRLEHAVRLDPTNERAAAMLERVFRRAERWEEVARVLERLADRSEQAATRVATGVRLARLYLSRLDDRERAARAYDRVLRDDPDHAEAMHFLSGFYSREERWNDLVALYERELGAKDTSSPDRLGDMLQIAMLHWRKLGHSADAEPWFERIRKLEPAHPGMLDFYREYSTELGDDGRLIEVLQGAQRASKDSAQKAAFGAEVARLAEGQENAQKAIEQYKSVLRQDPDNAEGRAALKRLYKQTQGYNALVELLRQELERTDANDVAARLAVLREVATVYRQYVKSDTALVSVLNQIVQLDEKLDENDVVELRELVHLYEKLGRWRELLTYQLKLAELSSDVEEKKNLYRAAARRWLEQFSNVQNATEAYEALVRVAPDDMEARDRLEDLYRKRRAWPALYALYERELEAAEGDARMPIMKEMAQLAAERLNKSTDAIRLFTEILELDPARVEVLDALERHAERAKDWGTLAHALERRVELLQDDATRLAVLQKLGTVYADHLGDHAAAARAWRRVLDLSPGHHRALRVLREAYLQGGDYDGLEELYGSQNDWEGLAEVLSNAADRAKDADVKVELSYRAAGVYEQHLHQPDRAFRSYERILGIAPRDERAARALIPLYEEDEKWSRLPPLYELALERAESDEERFELLKKLIEVTGHRLSDRKTAAEHARKAFDLAPENSEALELFEQACRAAGNWEPFVEALEARLAGTAEQPAAEAGAKRGKKRKKGAEAVGEGGGLDDTGRRDLELKLARAYADELGRQDQAAATFRRLLERDPADAEAANALEAILRRDDRRDELRWLLNLRVESAPSDADRVRLLTEWATLEEEVFESKERAAELYRRVLEVEPGDRTALGALPRLLIAAGDAAGAAEVIERHRAELDGRERMERDVELAELYLDRLSRPADALNAAVRALEFGDTSPHAMAVLDRLLQLPETRARAAEVLASQYATGGEARHEADALGVLLEQTENKADRLDLYGRLADVHHEKLGAFGTALDVILKALGEYPDELALWERADALASLAGRPTELAEALRDVLRRELPRDIETELCERAARLHEDKLGDPIGATPYLEKVLMLDAGNERAFKRLKDILTAAERWGELEALYDNASRATEDITRRIEMLVEVALICEEIIEDPEKATRYYERILELDPTHDAAARALDRLYARQGRHRELADLLARRLGSTSGDETLEVKLRLARIQLAELHQPDLAIVHVEDVLGEKPNDYDARELAEKMLEIGSLRGHSARLLEGVYEARDEIRDLVRVLSISLEELDRAVGGVGEHAEHRDLLRRIAVLRDERLHDDDGALDALSRLVPLDPLDTDARERLLEIGRRVGAHERVAEVLTRAADRAGTPAVRGEILMQVARIYEDLLNDADKAEAVYRRVIDLDENDAELVLPAARALERLYVGRGEHEKLAGVLRTQVRLEPDGDARRELLGRLGELSQSVLGDDAGAIDAWRTRVQENPGDARALAALDRLYEQTEHWRELVEILERRRDASEEASERRQLMTRAAQVLSDKLDNVPDAIDAWRAVIDEFGPDVDSLGALEKLLDAAERWDELAESYERHLDIVEGDAERLELLAQLGDLRREHLSDLEGALETYRRALGIDTSHEPSRNALEKLLEVDDHVARREAAEILHPIYEGEGDNEKLLKVLEIEVDTADDPMSRLEGLERAMHVAEAANAPARAFGYAERAVREAVGRAEIEPWLEHLERLAMATERQADYVRLLCEVVPEIFDGEVQLAVTLKIADLSRHQLADRELAREYYQKALELRADDKQALAALESLYEEAGDAQNLLDILERRVDSAESDDAKKQLLFRRARLLADVLNDNPRAVEAYEAILELGLDPGAVEALEKLYAAEQRWSELIELYERQLDQSAAKPADLHVKVARVARENQNDAARAFDELERALELEKQHDGAIAELERILGGAPEAEHRSRAASLLEPVYLMRADFNKVIDAIRARLDFAEDPEERRDLLGRLAQLYEEQKEDYTAALETTAKLLHEDLADEGTISELERLAKVAGAEARLADIYAAELEEAVGEDPSTARLARRAGELFAGLAQNDRALVYYRRALGSEPESQSLFEAIDGILRRTADHQARVDLYRDALDHRFEPAERLETLHTIAALEKSELGLGDQAIETYRSALEVDENDAVALDALTELYREKARWDDLADLYLRRAELAEEPEQSANYRLALARLCRSELGDTERAIDQLDEIVRSLPAHAETIKELEALLEAEENKERVVEILRPLYEQADDWRHLIHLNEDRYALADDPGQKVAVLRETARLWEERGNDPGRARRALSVAFEIDPDDPDTRAELERLTEVTDAWAELAESYDRALESHPDLAAKREILATLAEVHDQRRDDPRRALEAYERLHTVDESDLETLERVERLAMLLSDWQAVVRALRAKADLLLDDAERASTWRRIGEAKRDMLEDVDGAVEAYERALELDPDSAFTIDCLIGLYEDKGNPERLVELYQRRVELCEDDAADLKYELLVSAARAYEEKLEDRPRAIEALNQALSVRPGDADVLGGLNSLYRSESMWPELLDNLRLEASASESTERRAELRRQIGAILADELMSFDEALEAYRLVLEEASGDGVAIGAVRQIGRDHEELRETVAGILIPVLTASDRHEDLVDALEMRLTAETDPSDRAATLRSIADALESKLDRPADAESALLRALAERPDAAELHADVERLADKSDGWARYADALAERAQSTFDPELGKDLWVRLGRVAEDNLNDDRRAVDAYVRAVEQAGDQPELLEALDRLYTRLHDAQALSEVLERRVVGESSEATQADLHYRLAVLQLRDFEEPARALGSLRMALERAPEHEAAAEELEKLTDQRDLFEEAAEVLESVYRSRSATDRLAGLYEKRVGFAETPGERIDMRRSLARVLEEDCHDAASAQRVLQQGLSDDPNDASLLDELERLAPITGNWEGAAAALRDAIEKSPDLLPGTARDLAVRLATWQRDKIEDSRAAEQALLKALEFDPNSDEVLVLLEQLQRASGREADLVTTLRRRAKLALDEERREDLYRQAKQLADAQNDAALGEAILRDLLEQDDTNLWALGELTRLREEAGDYRETFELLVRRSELRAQGDVVRELRHKAAALARDHLDENDGAIALFDQLFEDDPNDAEASRALRDLYATTERWADLGRLLERLIELSESPSARSALRMELARLNAERFEAPDTAIDLLRAVIDEEPELSDAVVALSELYEKTQRDEELADLLASQIAAARERSDTDVELKFQVRLGEVYDSRLGDRGKAIETYRAVLEREPKHRGALEALARLFQAEGKHSDAAATLEQLLDMSEGEEAVRLSMALADEFAALQDAQNAARALERGLGVDHANEELRSRLRGLYESMQAWDKLAELMAGDADLTDDVQRKVELLRQAADIHTVRRADHAAAAELLNKASSLKPDDRDLLLQLCDAYSASGRGKAAAEVLEKIVESYGGKRSKELGEIHRRLATAYLADGETARALEELDKAFRIEPGNIAVLKKLGEVALEANDLKKAQQMFRALLLQKLDDSSPITKAEVFMNLGEVHQRLGETPKAIQMLERAVQSDDSLEAAKARLAELKG